MSLVIEALYCIYVQRVCTVKCAPDVYTINHLLSFAFVLQRNELIFRKRKREAHREHELYMKTRTGVKILDQFVSMMRYIVSGCLWLNPLRREQ